jgi:hypothetical protein
MSNEFLMNYAFMCLLGGIPSAARNPRTAQISCAISESFQPAIPLALGVELLKSHLYAFCSIINRAHLALKIGNLMTIIQQEDLIQSVADALQFISYYHPVDFIRSLAAAYEREQAPAARDAIAQLLINSRMCAEGHRPICQDTGIVTVFLKIGMDIHFTGPLSPEDMAVTKSAYATFHAPPRWPP